MNKRDNTVFILGVFFTLSVIFISGIISFYIKTFGIDIDKDTNKFAQFGDFIGGTLNPILAFLGFIALLYTIKIQSDELKATREELVRSSKAQEEQSKSLSLQNTATKQQIFENTFFQLVDLFNKTKEQVYIEISLLEIWGNDYYNFSVFTTFYHRIKTKNIKEGKFFAHEAIANYLIILKSEYYTHYDQFDKDYEAYTGNYFGIIYQIIKFIDDNFKEKNINNPEKYINILRALFVKNELEFLFYHALGTRGKKHFKGYLEKYEFFEHIILNDDIENQILEYDINAFGKNEKLITKYKELDKKSKNSK